MVILMNTDLIERLKSDVTAIVLQGETEHLFAKDQALAQFYPVLLSILRARPAWIESLGQQLNPKIDELFNNNPILKQQFLAQLDSTAPQDEIEQTLNRAIVPTMNFLQAEAGAPTAEAVGHLLDTHADSIQRALPVWAGPILASLGVSPLAGQNLNRAPGRASEPEAEPELTEEKKAVVFWPFILLVIIAAIILFFFRGCLRDDDPDELRNAQAVSEAAATNPAILKISTGSQGEIVNCQVQMNDPKYMQILQNEIKQIFNYSIGCGAVANENYHSEFIDQDTIPSVLKLLQGMSNVTLTWAGNQVSVQAANSADAQRLAGQIRGLAKNVEVVTQKPVDMDEAINTANTEAKKALDELQMENIEALDVATALNLQIIHFATGSTEIPEVNKSLLDQTAALLQYAKDVRLIVMGHTDTEGSSTQNQELSLKRAQAIVNYLVQKGVNPAQLQPVGMAANQPAQSNATSNGQYQNRRVTFEVMSTEDDRVHTVDNEGVVEKKAS